MYLCDIKALNNNSTKHRSILFISVGAIRNTTDIAYNKRSKHEHSIYYVYALLDTNGVQKIMYLCVNYFL